MLTYVLRRIGAALPVMAFVAIIVFSALRLTPNDPATIMAGEDATAAQLEAIRVSMGLDQSIMVQLGTWLQQLASGNLGVSLISNAPVLDLIADRIGPTVALATSTFFLTILVAIPLGIVAARRPGYLLDRMVMGFSTLGLSLPVFVIGYLLIYVFAVYFRWLPVQGYEPLSSGVWAHAQRLIMPSLALSGAYIALVARMTRSSIIEVKGEDFIRTARAKGASETSILIRHALRNAAIPIVTVIGAGIASLITGVVVTESVFNLPGLGRLVVEAVLARDYPVIQALMLLFSFVYILVNLIVDILYTVFDPRIRY
ncbi:ABC transporter permease [Mesorhizobium sp. CAU 1741]|uniref:ABC transporter permease n=1 Tax=Mesorhizobium sp. CAU 1741 TaxID=3140366 RepID=UPI00325BD9A0